MILKQKNQYDNFDFMWECCIIKTEQTWTLLTNFLYNSIADKTKHEFQNLNWKKFCLKNTMDKLSLKDSFELVPTS